MTKSEIESYLGITDNDNEIYKENVIKEFTELSAKYPEFEKALNEDLDVYIPYKKTIQTGKYISVFTN